ncbi:MAG: septal ring factor EnvC (AmiA/AmiB activator), partial [Planctomycetota bacterium]
MSTELKTLTSELLHCLREDITAQRQTLEMIEAQRVAIQDESIDGVEVTTARMVEQMRGMQERDQERQQLLDSFSSEFDIPEPELTISNLAESL